MSFLLLLAAARAHYPHDQAYWVAVSPDPDTPRVITSLERIELTLLGRSDDGRDWAARLVSAKEDGQVVAGVLLTPDRLALAVFGRGLVISEDAGDTMVDLAIDDPAIATVVASGSTAFAAGGTGVWRSEDAGLTWEPVLAGASTDLDLSPDFEVDGRVCAASGDTLACSTDGGSTWTSAGLPTDTARISVGAAGLWATTADGLYASADGEAWELVGFLGTELSAIAELSDGLVLLAEGDRALWRSTDGGETWSYLDVEVIKIDQSRDGINFFDFVEGPDGTVYFASWYGLGHSEDRGQTFAFYDTERPGNGHAAALTRVGDRVRAWIGTYGSGPLLIDPLSLDTRTFPASAARFTRDSMPTPTWGRDGVAILDQGYSTWRTVDHGASWEDVARDYVVDGSWQMADDVKAVALSPDPGADPFLLATTGESAMDFLYSEDLGETWTAGDQDPACAAGGRAVALATDWPDDARAWAACGGAVYQSVDRGRTWSVAGDTGASAIFTIVPSADGVLVATSDGVWRMAAETTRLGFPGAVVTSIAATQDTIFALVPAEGWFRSDDAGATWSMLPAPIAEVPRVVAVSPDFADDGLVVVTGYGGEWASTDRGESWYDIHTVDVYESTHDAWTKTGTWTRSERAGASALDVITSDEVGATATLEFPGKRVTLDAPSDIPSGAVTVRIDGGAADRLDLPGDLPWSSPDLADGWHTLVVEAVRGTATLDVVQVLRLPAEVDSGMGADAACGCRDGSAALLLPLALLRRRRAPPSGQRRDQ